MNAPTAVIENKIHNWQHYLEQLHARRRQLEEELENINNLVQQHVGAMQGATELLHALRREADAEAKATWDAAAPADETPAPAAEAG